MTGICWDVVYMFVTQITVYFYDKLFLQNSVDYGYLLTETYDLYLSFLDLAVDEIDHIALFCYH